MDIALMIHRLVPSAEYFGSLTDNTQSSFDSISWQDNRSKPSWQDILDEWDAYQSELTEPTKVRSLALPGLENKHFQAINYVTELNTTLFPKRSFNFGALTNVKWYSDSQLTDLILNVDIDYNYNLLGLVTDRTVTRTWYTSSGNPHPQTKVTVKDYTINLQDQLDEAIIRRTNNIRQTNLWLIQNVPTLTMSDPSITDTTAIEVRDDGVAFYEKYESESNVYIETGSTLLEQSVINETDPQWDWFDTDATSLSINGVSDIRDYIIYQLSKGQRNKNGDIV